MIISNNEGFALYPNRAFNREPRISSHSGVAGFPSGKDSGKICFIFHTSLIIGLTIPASINS